MEGLRVLYSDPHLLCVWKPGGVPSQSDPTGDPSVIELLSQDTLWRSELPLGLPHRLDRPVSGALLLTRSQEALVALSALFAEGKVAKRYWAIVEGRPPEKGTWENVLAHDARTHRSRVVRSGGGGRPVRLEYARLAQGERYSLLELAPVGGFFHQLRAQCGAAGHPIKGDVKYGARRGEPDRTIALHARSVSFPHPIERIQLHIDAPPPQGALWNALAGMVEGR